MKTSIKGSLKGLQASEIDSEWAGSQTLRKRLIELLIEEQNRTLKKRRGEDMYESPNWALLQADAVGYERGLEKAISLLS